VTKKIINQVQEYLTYCGEDRVYQIVNVEVLLKRVYPDFPNNLVHGKALVK
jgi:hypothetical protein